MSRYDGLIIPRSYSEYINKTDAATLQQALQLSGVLSGAVAAGDNKAVKSSAVFAVLAGYDKNNQQIENNTDLDNIKNQGWYFCPNNTTASTILNHPRTQKDSFGLRVVKTKQDASGNIQQIFYSEVGYIYKRSFSNQTWGDWARIFTETDVNNTLANLMTKEERRFSSVTEKLDFPISNEHLHIFYSSLYSGRGLFLFVLPQYNAINIINNYSNGFVVEDKSSKENMKIEISLSSWNTNMQKIVHIIL